MPIDIVTETVMAKQEARELKRAQAIKQDVQCQQVRVKMDLPIGHGVGADIEVSRYVTVEECDLKDLQKGFSKIR